MDPHTGRPVVTLASATVVGPSITVADGYATAAFAMGPAGTEWAASLPGCEVFAVDADGQVLRTRGLPVAGEPSAV